MLLMLAINQSIASFSENNAQMFFCYDDRQDLEIIIHKTTKKTSLSSVVFYHHQNKNFLFTRSLMMRISSMGRSFASRLTVDMLSATGIPLRTSPKTV